MRKLKLQMQITVDGFVAGPNGELDWMIKDDMDDKLRAHIDSLAGSSDTILMGRKMTEGFVNYWTNAVKEPEGRWFSLAKMMVDYPKIVFTKTLDKSPWPNTTLAKGNIVDEVNRAKNHEGKDIIVYGGAGFVSSLIKHNLIDEYHLFVNPVAIGNGMTIFKDLGRRFDLKQLDATPYACGVTVHKYLPATAKAAVNA
jgi:dihydrofolate reductase